MKTDWTAIAITTVFFLCTFGCLAWSRTVEVQAWRECVKIHLPLTCKVYTP